MKNFLKKSNLVFIIFFVIAPIFSFAGTEVLNGGVGVKTADGVTTLFSAQLAPIPESIDTVPSLREALIAINKLGIDPKLKMKVQIALFPNNERQYFKASYADINIKKDIFKMYAELLNIKDQNFSLFALTNTASKTTYLLPEFYQLNPNQQAALLFHEAMWVVFPDMGYDDMVQIDSYFQAFLEDPRDFNLYYNFHSKLYRILGDEKLTLYAAVKWDAKYNPQQNVGLLFNDYLDKYVSTPPSLQVSEKVKLDNQLVLFNHLLQKMMASTPMTMVEKALLDLLATENYVIDFTMARRDRKPNLDTFSGNMVTDSLSRSRLAALHLTGEATVYSPYLFIQLDMPKVSYSGSLSIKKISSSRSQ